MIELRRLRLVNWHNFSDDLLEFKQFTYLIGVNAVGKTTIMDAIRYCLTTSKNFNALGNKKSGRTLRGSIHGKQRGNNIYTRPGHTVSYIGTEFMDSSTHETFVIVVRVESESPTQEMHRVQQTWFITPSGCTLESLPFVNPVTHQPTSKEQFRLLTDKMPPIEKQSIALDKICKMLGVGRADSTLGKKFSAVFQMGTSLDEIPDFRTFICDYVLPLPEINLDTLQRDSVELERLHDVLIGAQQKADKLVEIVEVSKVAASRQHEVDVNEGFICYAVLREAAMREETAEFDIEHGNQRIELLQNQYQDLVGQADAAHESYMVADRAAKENDESKMLEILRQQEGQKKSAHLSAERALKQLLKAEDELQRMLDKAAIYHIVLPQELWLGSIQNSPPQNRLALLQQMIECVKEMRPEAERIFMSVVQEKALQQQKAKALNQTIHVLSGGRWLYPEQDRANVVKREVNAALVSQGMEADARILCELLYMNDPAWQECVEACLGNRRFDILVSPKHYQTAKRVYQQMGEEVGRVSLLDTPALARDTALRTEMDADSLAAKVSSENPLAFGYIANLLGNIICCENADTLEQHKHSATSNLLRHYPYRLERMGKPQLFIGLDARKRQLDDAKKELGRIEKLLMELEVRYKSAEELRNTCNSVVYGTTLSSLVENWDGREKQAEAWQQYEQLHNKILEYEENPLLKGYLQRADLIKKGWQDLQKMRENVGANIQICEKDVKNAQELQIKAVEDGNQASDEWQKYCQKNKYQGDDIQKKYLDAAKRNTPPQIVSYRRSRHRQVENSCNDFINNSLIPLQRQFNERYTCDLPIGMDGIEPFQRQHESLITVDLERFSASLSKAQERCKERFRKDILYHMKDDIANAKRQFKELNQIMSQLNYGEEVYRFAVDGSSDPQYSLFYNLIVDKGNLQLTEENTLDNFVAMRDAAYEAQVDELMERILADINEKSKARQEGKKVNTELSQYVDYRTYLDYDIQVTNRVTGEKVFLSTVSQDSSGGENQAPFYIAICASLLQIYQKSDQSVRLILLDEAFSKMTSDRIRPMMQMLRQMDLQVILITTVEKSSAVYPYCDAIYSIIKKGMRNAVMPFVLDEP